MEYKNQKKSLRLVDAVLTLVWSDSNSLEKINPLSRL